MKTLINKAFFLFSASLIRLILPQITSKNASQNASMQVKMQVKISPINAKNPDYHISGNPGIVIYRVWLNFKTYLLART